MPVNAGCGHCCGMIDYSGLNTPGKTVTNVLSELRWSGVRGSTVLFTERRYTDKQARKFPMLAGLKKEIKEHKLGSFATCAAAPNPVHCGRTIVKAAVFSPDWDALQKYCTAKRLREPVSRW